MGFKTDTSFLKYLTMGAVGVRSVIDALRAQGFEPIELERYCGSNKLWMTKLKRLRLPDLLCIRSGLRLEVRAKSALEIKMSDAPGNAERTWDAGLRDDDLIAFIVVQERGAGFAAASPPALFSVATLRASAGLSKLGEPKSADEGAERGRTWGSVVPKRPGVVTAVDSGRLVVRHSGDGRPERPQTYKLSGRHSYVKVGDKFEAGTAFLAGLPASMASLGPYRARAYAPLAELESPNAIDRYAAAKAIRHRGNRDVAVQAALDAQMFVEMDERVRLEIAAASAGLGSGLGQEYISQELRDGERADLKMEAVLILTEIGDGFARQELKFVAQDPRYRGQEIRQAALWGLGKKGLKAYADLVAFVADEDEQVAMHAITAFGNDAPQQVVHALVAELVGGDPRKAAAASEALRVVGSDLVARELVDAATGPNSDWVVATLGRMPSQSVARAITSGDLRTRVAPLLLLGADANWLATGSRVDDMAFLARQDI